MSTEPSDGENTTKTATIPGTFTPEESCSEDSGSERCSTDSSSDSMTTADTTSLDTTSLADTEKMFNTLSQLMQGYKADIVRLEMENKKLSESLAGAKSREDDAVKKNIKLQEKLDEMEQCGGARDIVALKGKCDGLEKQILDILHIQEKKDPGQIFEDYQQKMEKRIVEVQQQSQQNLEQAIDRIKAQQALEMQGLTSAMGFMCLDYLKDGYIFKEKPLKMIPDGMIQVSRAKASESNDRVSDGPPREDEDSCFLYVVRDQYKDFKKFTNLAESVFGLDAGHLNYLKGTKSNFLGYNKEGNNAQFINKWEKEASQKDRVYILLDVGLDYISDTVYYVDD
ncbi:hypothetical protein FPQ18DRAFT_376130 [Pyronema domesticum]|nr:hypothetical protein FPQ18DRAFT_376130 [Pyronema domesticum]